jgi:hypothetical protein
MPLVNKPAPGQEETFFAAAERQAFERSKHDRAARAGASTFGEYSPVKDGIEEKKGGPRK